MTAQGGDKEKAELYQKLIADEIHILLTENRKLIIKRAEKKLRAMLKSAV